MTLPIRILFLAVLLATLTNCAHPTPTSPPAKFYGLEFETTRVVYILDHSGSMLDNFDFLKQEIIQSTNQLPASKKFNIIMVAEEAHPIFPKPQLATSETKKTLAIALEKTRAMGANCDLLAPYQQAFESAFAMKPDAIYFLTDGHFDPKLTNIVQKLNADKKTKIHTLAFINQEPDYEAQLKDLAKANAGTYKFVSEKDLGK